MIKSGIRILGERSCQVELLNILNGPPRSQINDKNERTRRWSQNFQFFTLLYDGCTLPLCDGHEVSIFDPTIELLQMYLLDVSFSSRVAGQD